MVQTVEAILELDGSVRLLEPVRTTTPRRALVMILQESPEALPSETAILSESALADWNRTEEDVAWSHLPSVKLS